MRIALFYFGILLLPGAISVWLARFRSHRFLYSFFISIAFFIFSQVPFRIGGGSLSSWIVFYGVSIVILIFVSAYHGLKVTEKDILQKNNLSLNFHSRHLALLITVMTVWLIIFSVIGPYTEVPSDFWGHLVRTQWELGAISSGQLPSYASSPLTLTLFNREYIHNLHALAWRAFDAKPSEVAYGAQLATTSIFTISLFFFSITQFPDRWSSVKKISLAITAVTLSILSLGSGNWAFIRYYAFAPVILNLPIFFLGLILFIQFLKNPQISLWNMLGWGIPILLCLALIHLQEAIFLGIFIFLITLLAYGQSLSSRFDLWSANNLQRISIMALVLSILGIVTLSFVIGTLPPLRSHPGVLFDLGQFLPMLNGLLILDPSRQVFATIALSGTAAYIIVISNWRLILSSPYLTVAFLLPFLTIFNPLFIEFWQRLLPTTLLWRFSLLIPSGIALAYILGRQTECSSRPRTKKLLITLVSITCFIPIDIDRSGIFASRLPSLIPLNESQDIHWIEDVVEFLETQPRQTIRTDPVTSYVLRGMTNHLLPGRKFYSHTSGIDFSGLSMKQLIEVASSGLVLVNLRDGSDSKTVAALGHWKSNELEVSRFYPTDFISKLSKLGLKIIWQRDRIYILELINQD